MLDDSPKNEHPRIETEERPPFILFFDNHAYISAFGAGIRMLNEWYMKWAISFTHTPHTNTTQVTFWLRKQLLISNLYV